MWPQNLLSTKQLEDTHTSLTITISRETEKAIQLYSKEIFQTVYQEKPKYTHREGPFKLLPKT